ncbi:MAG: saccharopine dehydrogenase NADP-binding domain-containing protein, partial [Thermodesulfobacteriota bacterium]
MKIALLGAAGFVGRAAALELSRRPEVGELLLVDYVIKDAKKMAKALSPKCRYAMADVGKAPELARLLEGIDAVASAVGPCAEYEKTILLTCAAARVPAASVGDLPLPPGDRDEIHAAFRSAGLAAVSGCGMMPGWTDLLAAHYLEGAAATAPSRFLFFSPDRFGGYAFLRDCAKRIGAGADAPRGAPPGRYFSTPDGSVLGVPGNKAGARVARITGSLGKLGTVGKEFAGASLLWLRGSMTAPPGTPAAVCGVAAGKRTARLEDPAGTLGSILLAEAAVRLATRAQGAAGLLPIGDLVGKEAA